MTNWPQRSLPIGSMQVRTGHRAMLTERTYALSSKAPTCVAPMYETKDQEYRALISLVFV